MEHFDKLQGAVIKTHSNILRSVAYSQLLRKVNRNFSAVTLYIPPPPHACIHHPGGYGIGGCVGVILALTLMGKTMLIHM